MNARALVISGVVGASLCFAMSGHVSARGITARPPTGFPPGQPDAQSDSAGLGIHSTPPPNAGTNQPPVEAPPPFSLGPTNAPSGPQIDQTAIPTPVNRASHLIGMTVKNSQNQPLGKIRDVVIDLRTSRVPYLILEKYGHTHGSGSRLAVPLNHFTQSPDHESLLLNAEKSQFQAAAGFSGENLPSMSNPAFGGDNEPTRREIFIVPVPVRPDQDQDQDKDQHEAIPPHPKKGPTVESP